MAGTVQGKGCRECAKRSWRDENWEKYGIKNESGAAFTTLDYDRAYQVQSGKCAICGVHQSDHKHSLHADHEHATGLFRGLLCFQCNSAVGNVKENISIVVRLGEYLTAHPRR